MKFTPEETRAAFELMLDNPVGFYSLVNKYCPPERLQEVKKGLLALGVSPEQIYVDERYTGNRATRKRKKHFNKKGN